MKKKRIIILLIIILGIYLFFRNTPFNDISYNLNRFISKVTNTSEYKTIKQEWAVRYFPLFFCLFLQEILPQYIMNLEVLSKGESGR